MWYGFYEAYEGQVQRDLEFDPFERKADRRHKFQCDVACPPAVFNGDDVGEEAGLYPLLMEPRLEHQRLYDGGRRKESKRHPVQVVPRQQNQSAQRNAQKRSVDDANGLSFVRLALERGTRQTIIWRWLQLSYQVSAKWKRCRTRGTHVNTGTRPIPAYHELSVLAKPRKI